MPTGNRNADSETPERASNSSQRWKDHLYRVGPHGDAFDCGPPEDKSELRKKIEPWLSAVFQSDHLSLLLGSGFTNAVACAAGAKAADMGNGKFEADCGEKINAAAAASATKSDRGQPNFEDYIRVANELLRGFEIQGCEKQVGLRKDINTKLTAFLQSLLETEKSIYDAFAKYDENAFSPCDLPVSFLLSFASRATSRERLSLFTTNYDRLIEYGCDLAGLHVIDRFVGALMPIFRAGRLNIDLHYNPPGIRGEPRYMEGVIHLFKLHGSLDWRQEGKHIRRYGIPFGASSDHPDILKEPVASVMVYPNAAKDMETSEYPYAELFRDLAGAICRPNSALVTYGYGFGDDHINRVIRDMLTIPSTHLVIISYDNTSGRVERFCNRTGHEAQVSLLIGSHFGNLPDLVETYLPKPAIDLISARRAELLKRREVDPSRSPGDGTSIQKIVQEGESHDVPN